MTCYLAEDPNVTDRSKVLAGLCYDQYLDQDTHHHHPGSYPQLTSRGWPVMTPLTLMFAAGVLNIVQCDHMCYEPGPDISEWLGPVLSTLGQTASWTAATSSAQSDQE